MHQKSSSHFNAGRAITNQMLINEIRRAEILKVLQHGPGTAHKLSLEMPGVCSTGTVICRLHELKAAGKVENFGGLWRLKP